MQIIFKVNFNTVPGQEVYISGSIPELGNGEAKSAIKMEYIENGDWIKEIRISSRQERIIKYKYLVRNGSGGTMYEVGQPRVLAISTITKNIVLCDEWQGNTPTAPFLSTPFAGVFFQHQCKGSTPTHLYSRELIVRVTVPNVEKGSVVLMCGAADDLGAWNPSKAVEMIPVYGAKWEKHFPAENIGKIIEFKFIKRSESGEITWEEGRNRTFEIPDIKVHETYSMEYSMCNLGIREPRFAGTAVPVFSLRSKDDWGIGDFSDLKQLVDWASATKQSIVQILPVNDTSSTLTWTDSYPYGGISIMALHPIYLNPSLMGTLKPKEPKNKKKKDQDGIEEERKRLNALPAVDYEAVLRLKTKYFRAIFEQDGEADTAEPEFYTFYKKNVSWLLPYAAFCTLRDRFGTADFSKWGKFTKYSERLVKKMYEEVKAGKEMRYHIFLQYHLHKQLMASCAYAHEHGVAIKGDIPIGITPHSVEAWTEPYYFNLDCQAGAPPDDFSVKGQNWGFPTYNWERMASDGYIWWKRRFMKMAEYCDAYRIDHILGFFRIWEIPSTEVTGLMGHFNPAIPYSYEDLLGYGFDFHFERDAKPFIRFYQLREMFGDDCTFVQETFLDSNELDVFTLKPDFSTQKAIEAWFGIHGSELKCTHSSADLCDGVMALVSEVLFMEDPKQTGKFHPRISAQFTYSYKDLPENQKNAFNRLYDDFFYSRHNGFWQEKAMQKLPELISATNMLTCAEDLGMVPSCVPYVLSTLRILSLEVQRMPKDPHIHIGNPADYPYLSVCTTGSHDTSSLRGWLEETNGGSTPTPSQCESIIRDHLGSPSMLTILPLQDWMSIDASSTFGDPKDERINVPAEVHHYWKFRMPVTLEELTENKALGDKMKKLITDCGR
ncbi:MAG: 4-alpha-glucanotransferase [Bacteroidales bacterium]|jgi:4-alpha-glucanotransferase|nr:4-alpha-glucanotransferase [Bacteroidales bacterium]MCI2121340.1 4-alpha-glucanotransferase [Bacteroidales bacterium]MCI2145909.1 4-alpha-glucanotransferase [Bacteroidales bacterium]